MQTSSGRSNAVVTFDDAPEPGHINFGIGQPSPDLLPLELVRVVTERFFAHAQPLELNYGPKQGDVRFRTALSGLLEREYGSPAPPETLFLTAGNSQALDFVCSRFTRPGDIVFVEDPSYFLAFQILRDHGLEVIGVPVDADGLDVEALERELVWHRPTLLYTIPSYHNPTGVTMSHERRARLVELSNKYGFIIAADEVYQMLWYDDPPPRALGTWAGEGNVVSMGSFSKILAPAMRLGWIQTNADLMSRLLASGIVNSGGSLNQFASHIVRNALEEGLVDGLIKRLRQALGERVATMDRALRAETADFLEWQVPEGGYFFWLKMRGETDTTALKARAGEFKTGFQPGELFSAGGGALRDYLRLSFSHYTEPDIVEGVSRLAALLETHAKRG
jgi:2-aminoadipate transaminase